MYRTAFRGIVRLYQRDVPALEGENNGTLIMDGSCSPLNIRYPQDFLLLNDAREKTEEMIAALHKQTGDKRHPRMKKVLGNENLAMPMSKKRTANKVHSLIRKQLYAIKRNMAFINSYIPSGSKLSRRHSV